MKKRSSYIFIRILFAVLLSLFFSSNSFADGVLNVPERIQEHSQWCWDASSKANLDYYGTVVSQCVIANWAWTLSDCCGNTTFDWDDLCNRPNSMNAIRDVHAHWGVNGNVRNYALTQATVTSEINAGRPFIMAWFWTGGGGHALSGRGIMGSNVYYMDPWPGNGYTISTYAWVVNGTGHTWGQTLQITTNPTVVGRAEIIGTWGNGIFYRNLATSTWTQMYPYIPEGTRPIAAGDVTGDGRADLVACWNSGLWYQNGATLGWTKVWAAAPGKVACGDVTGAAGAAGADMVDSAAVTTPGPEGAADNGGDLTGDAGGAVADMDGPITPGAVGADMVDSAATPGPEGAADNGGN